MNFDKDKNILIMSDSFKGTMSSLEVCNIINMTVKEFLPKINTKIIPIADGGEGTVDAFIKIFGGEKRTINVQGPLPGSIQSSTYGILSNGCAVIEVSASVGLPLIEGVPEVMKYNTYGVGELILDSLDHGVRKIIIGLGGSSTNDGGAGACAALGYKFIDGHGNMFIPTGETLVNIDEISTEGVDKRIKNISIMLMTDVDNPLIGSFGAAEVFGHQKGASKEDIKILNKGLEKLANAIYKIKGQDIKNIPGAGAAGGMGGGLGSLLEAKLYMGIDLLLDTINFDNMLINSSLVITGEGKLDSQSLNGKVVVGIARRAKKYSVPVLAIVGDIDDTCKSIYENGISAAISINRVAIPYGEAKLRSKKDLKSSMENVMRLLAL